MRVCLYITLCVSIVTFSQALGTQNTKSEVLELNDRFPEVKDDGLWLVKFYAPWCGHCKALNPIWEQLAHELADTSIRVARIDCTRYGSIAHAFDVHGFPTIKFFRHGSESTYDGERSKAALLDFSHKSSGPPVRPVDSHTSFVSIRKQHAKAVYFVYATPETHEQTQTQLFKDYQTAAEMLISRVYFYSASPNTISESSPPEPDTVYVYKDGVSRTFSPDSGSVYDWLNRERWPAYPLVNYGNLKDIGGCCDRVLVLAVLDQVQKSRPNTDIAKFDKLLSHIAKEHQGDPELSDVQFGWLDGNSLANSIVLGTMPIPSLLVFNYTTNQFYLPDDTAQYSTEHSIILFLQSVLNGERTALGGRNVVQRFKRIMYELVTTVHNMFSTQPLLTCCLFGLPAGVLAIICYSMCSADFTVDRDEVYPDSEEEEYSDEDEDHEKVD